MQDFLFHQPAVAAPFPYFGGKSTIASEVWQRLGNTPNYIEPFLGSAAVLLSRPNSHRWWDAIETVNDKDGFVSNFWRATQGDPEAVAHWADWPVNENDLHARHAWLVNRKDSLQQSLEGTPDYYDAMVAGWWLWGICIWIGSGWCSGKGPWQLQNGQLTRLGGAGVGIKRTRTHLGDAGTGINRKLTHLGNGGRGINRKLTHLGAGQGICATWTEHLVHMMAELRDRLRRVRVECGDWSRICGPAPTEKQGLTGVFLDPPYSHTAGRDENLYTVEDGKVAQEVREWAVAHGDHRLYRIALCGYEGEHEMPVGWVEYAWRAGGGYSNQGDGRGRANRIRERVWFSPWCLETARAAL